MAVYSISDLSRREILKMSAVVAGSAVAFSTKFASAAAALARTPPSTVQEGRDLLITKLLDPSPEFEPDSKMAIFDIVLFKG